MLRMFRKPSSIIIFNPLPETAHFLQFLQLVCLGLVLLLQGREALLQVGLELHPPLHHSQLLLQLLNLLLLLLDLHL